MLMMTDYLNKIFKEFQNRCDKRIVDMHELREFMNQMMGNNPGNGADEETSIYNEQEDRPEKPQLYLLKFAYAYGFEYLFMCNELIEDFLKDKDKEEISAISLGCGTRLDYWALVYMLNMRKKDEADKKWPVVKYIGIDTIEWKYSFDAKAIGEDEKNFQFFKKSFKDFFERPDNGFGTHDVYFFPKSICEFTNDDMKILLDNLPKIQKNTIYFCITLRKTAEAEVEPGDAGKAKKIINKLEKTGFQVKELKYIADTNEDKIKSIARDLLGVENVIPKKLGSKKKKIEETDFAKRIEYRESYDYYHDPINNYIKDELYRKCVNRLPGNSCEECKYYPCNIGREERIRNITYICDLIIKFERR